MARVALSLHVYIARGRTWDLNAGCPDPEVRGLVLVVLKHTCCTHSKQVCKTNDSTYEHSSQKDLAEAASHPWSYLSILRSLLALGNSQIMFEIQTLCLKLYLTVTVYQRGPTQPVPSKCLNIIFREWLLIY